MRAIHITLGSIIFVLAVGWIATYVIQKKKIDALEKEKI